MVTSPVHTRRPHGGVTGVGPTTPVVSNGAAPDDELDQLLASIGLASRPGDVTPVVGPVALSPVQAAARLLDRRQLVLLVHSSGATATSRYSYVSADPFLVLRSRGRRSELAGPDGTVTVAIDPFPLARTTAAALRGPATAGVAATARRRRRLLRVRPRAAVRTLAGHRQETRVCPDFHVGFYDWVLAADHFTGQRWLISTGLPGGSAVAAHARWRELQASLGAEQATAAHQRRRGQRPAAAPMSDAVPTSRRCSAPRSTSRRVTFIRSISHSG